MKILIIHCVYQYQGGEYTVVQEEMKLLQSIGNAIKLLQFTNKGNKFLKLLQLPFNIPSYIKTIKTLKLFRPDVVHIHNLHFGGSASVIYAIKRKKIPLIITLHNFRLLCPSATLFFNGKVFLDSLNQKFYWSAIKKGVYKNSSALTFWLSVSMRFHQWLKTWKKPDKYIVLSRHSKELFLHSRLGIEERQLVIKPNFILPPVLKKTFRNDHFLFIGRLSDEKGIDILLETFSKLNQYSLMIAGEGPLKKKVAEYTRKCLNIDYLGVLNIKRIHAELQKCSALVFPSIWYEGMPLTIIESFACGTPVIASKLGAMQNMIKDGYNGLHFDPEDKNDLELQLKKWMLLSEEERSVFRANALETYRQNYTPEKNAEQLVAIYNSVIKDDA